MNVCILAELFGTWSSCNEIIILVVCKFKSRMTRVGIDNSITTSVECKRQIGPTRQDETAKRP